MLKGKGVSNLLEYVLDREIAFHLGIWLKRRWRASANVCRPKRQQAEGMKGGHAVTSRHGILLLALSLH